MNKIFSILLILLWLNLGDLSPPIDKKSLYFTLIKRFETFHKTGTYCGYGHYNREGFKSLTLNQADSLLRADFAAVYNKYTMYSIDTSLILATLAYNIGYTGVKNSGILKYIGHPLFEEKYMCLVYRDGVPSTQLVRRRYCELNILKQ